MSSARLLLGGVTSTSVRLRVESAGVMPRTVQSRPAAAGAHTSTRRVEPDGRPVAVWALDVDGLSPGTSYEIRIAELPGPSVRFRTPPARLADGPVLLGLLSCYFPSDEYADNARAVTQCFAAREAVGQRAGLSNPSGYPHATFVCGDQIYADVPREPGKTLEEIYRSRYDRLFESSRYGAVLATTGTYCVGDDHEFWNGYPELMPWLSRSWPWNWAESSAVATEAYWSAQGQWNFPPGIGGGEPGRRSWAVGTLGEVEIFVADTRSERTSRDGSRDPLSQGGRAPQPRFMSERQLQALETWLASIQCVGVLIVGQPIVQAGSKTDCALSDYALQYARLARGLRTAVEQRNVSVVVLTGDIHWGRVLSWQPSAKPGAARLIELTASPTALVALASILGLGIPIAPKADVRGKPTADEFALFAQHFGPTPPLCHVATKENNLGLVELSLGPKGRPQAAFELWDLARRTIAYDDWHAGNRLARVVLDL